MSKSTEVQRELQAREGRLNLAQEGGKAHMLITHESQPGKVPCVPTLPGTLLRCFSVSLPHYCDLPLTVAVSEAQRN